MNVLVGCPVRNRNWILPEWKSHVEAAIPDGWDYSFVFVVGDDDFVTMELVQDWDATLIPVLELDQPVADHAWGKPGRYEHMVFIRNKLLSYMRLQKPDLFLSVDSDILLHPESIENMAATLERLSVSTVGGLTYFDPLNQRTTNVAYWKTPKKSFTRIRSQSAHIVDVIMGIKLMTPTAYNIDYTYHHLGEDIGWCSSLFEKGLKLGYDGRVGNKHVMHPKYLGQFDARIGW